MFVICKERQEGGGEGEEEEVSGLGTSLYLSAIHWKVGYGTFALLQ